MEIINIKLKSKNNPNVFVAQTDKGDYELHSDIIVKNSIKVGEIEEDFFCASVNESLKIIAFNIAVKYISGKLKTEKQIKDYLYKKEYPSFVVGDVIDKLKEYSIIDDNNFVESYVRANSNFSKNKLKQKMYSFGIKSDLANESVEEIDEFESCYKNANKYLKNKILDKPTIEKLIRRLQGMGYAWESIKSVLNKLKVETDD